MSRNKLYTNRVEICLNEAQHKALIKFASKQGKRVSEIIREAIEIICKI